jgi:hypothetical protein
MEKNIYKIGKGLFITSDEEIKEGDWCYQVELNDGKIDKCYDVTLYHTWTNNGVDKKIKYKKIILTTDQDLIKDGVQAIDDEFLEWFIKNPSCERVEVFHQDVYSMGKWDRRYKIIIPKKEQNKQMYSEEDMREAFENGVASGKYQQEYGLKGSMDFNYFIEQFKNK